jgi:hypothetical protein
VGGLRGKVENLEDRRHKARGSHRGWIKGPDGPYIGWITSEMQRENQRNLEEYFRALEAYQRGEEIPPDPAAETDPMMRDYWRELEQQELARKDLLTQRRERGEHE